MGLIHKFYCCDGKTTTGLRLESVLAWPDEKLEASHSFIQWLFPLPSKSIYNPLAPRLTGRERELLVQDARFAPNMLRAYRRMCEFYGFEASGSTVARGARFEERASVWLAPGNHNYLRLTRMLKSLRLLGFEAESAALYDALATLCQTGYGRTIGEKSQRYWRQTQL